MCFPFLLYSNGLPYNRQQLLLGNHIYGFTVSDNAYLFESLEVEETELVDILWLISEDLSSEIVENIWEALGHWVLLDVFACHIISNYFIYIIVSYTLI